MTTQELLNDMRQSVKIEIHCDKTRYQLLAYDYDGFGPSEHQAPEWCFIGKDLGLVIYQSYERFKVWQVTGRMPDDWNVDGHP